MWNIVDFATEAELAAMFHNVHYGIPLLTHFIEMGHPQAKTPIQTDNPCASGIANQALKERRSKPIDMHLYWIQDRIKQGQFLVHCRRGADNLADYFTKHHSPCTIPGM
jgi:hypothetical protein